MSPQRSPETSPDITSVKRLINEYTTTQLKQLKQPTYEQYQNKNADINKAQSTDITFITLVIIVVFSIIFYISIHSFALLPTRDTELLKLYTFRATLALLCIYTVYLIVVRLKNWPIVRIQLSIAVISVIFYYEQIFTSVLYKPIVKHLYTLLALSIVGVAIYLFWYRKALSSLRTNDKSKQIVAPVHKSNKVSSKAEPTDESDDDDSDTDRMIEPVHPLWTNDESDSELDSEVSRGKQLKRLLQQLAHKRIDQLSKRFGSFNKLSELAKKHIVITPPKHTRRPTAIQTDLDNDSVSTDKTPIDSLYDQDYSTQAGGSTLHDELYFLSSKYISMPRSAFDALHDQLEWVVLQSHKLIYAKGDAADTGMYIIMDGSVAVLDDYNKVLCLLQQGDSFGEIELLTNWQRSRTVKTTQPTTLMRITRNVFDSFTAERPDIYVSFIKTSLSRQWRIATFVLDEFLNISVRDYNAEQLLHEQLQQQNGLFTFDSPPITPVSPNMAARQQSYRSETNSRPPSYVHQPSANNIHSNQLPDPDTLHRYSSNKLHTFISEQKDKLQRLQEQTEIIELTAGQVLFDAGSHIHDMLYIVIEGRVVATRDISDTIENTDDIDIDDTCEIYDIGIGGLVGAVPFVTGCKQPYTCRTMTKCKLAVFTQAQLNAVPPAPVLVDMCKLVAEIVAPTLLQFSSLGLKREWRRAGDTLFQRGSKPTDVYIVIHGRVRTINNSQLSSNKLKSSGRGSEINTNNKIKRDNDIDETPYRDNTMFGKQLDRDALRIEVGRGESVGEVALLMNDNKDSTTEKRNNRHSTTAICVRDTEVVRISKPAFEHMKRLYPQVMNKFSSILATRLQELLSQDLNAIPKSPFVNRSHTCLVITLLPHTSTVPVHKFAQQLLQSLQPHGAALHIDTNTIDRILGTQTSEHLHEYHQRLRLTSYINDMETQHRFLLLEAKPNTNEWTQCCCRVADCILVVANSNEKPSVPSFEMKLLWKQHKAKMLSSNDISRTADNTVHTDNNTDKYKRTFSRNLNKRQNTHVNFCIKDIVLLHTPDTILPTGTRRWFANRCVHSYHHIRIDLTAHYDRLARYLSGKTVGVVLSGGGARGLAHLGVINALCDQNIPIDMIGGTSQGSFMSALYALQAEHDRHNIDTYMAARTQKMANKLGSIWELLRDATLPTMSYFDGYNFSATIRDLLGATVQIEDLWIKYLCVTTNMSTADMCVHRQGVLWKAVRASMTILDYLPPMQISAQSPDLLIDGGYTNNCPVDVMRYYYQPTKCIAVDVENKDDERLSDVNYYGSSLSGWWLFLRKIYSAINPFAVPLKIPKYTELVSSLVFINHNRTIRYLLDSNLIDLYIRPELGQTQLLDYHKLNDIVDIGYKYGKLKITEFRINYHNELAFVKSKRTKSNNNLATDTKRRSITRNRFNPFKNNKTGDYIITNSPSITHRSVSSINVQSMQADKDNSTANIVNGSVDDNTEKVELNHTVSLPMPVPLNRSSTLPPQSISPPSNDFSSSI